MLKYDGQIQGMQIPKILHMEENKSAEPEKWTLCGSLCTTADILVRKIEMEGLVMDDVLAFHNIGAYSVTEGPALFLSRNMPRIILADDKGARLVRDTIHSSSINQGNL
jgi:diaminopimelate decarboxylase